MTERDMPAKRRRQRSRSNRSPPPRWPVDPADGDDIDVDVEAIAHVLANTCLWGGAHEALFCRSPSMRSLCRRRSTRWTVSPAKTGVPWRSMPCSYRRVPPGSATKRGDHPASAQAAARAKAHGAAIDRAVCEAAGLDPDPPEDWAEVLRFVARMTDAAERRDLGVEGGSTLFPPLRRTLRPLAPETAAERWLARFRDLAGLSPADTADVRAGSEAVVIPEAAVEAQASQ